MYYSEEEIDSIVFWLFHWMTGWNKGMVSSGKNEFLSAKLYDTFADVLPRLKQGEPVQYITGMVDFLDLKLIVNASVLIPRPETEELADLIIREHIHRRYQSLTVLDIGTGSGCLSLALKQKFPYAQVTGLDISEEALEVAQRNAVKNGLNVDFLFADILDRSGWRNFPSCDLIISNPPYIPEHKRSGMASCILDYEPGNALFVPDEDPLLFYRAVSAFAKAHLVTPGWVYMEIHESFGSQVTEIFKNEGFDPVRILRDIRGKERFAAAEMPMRWQDTSYWMVDKQLP